MTQEEKPALQISEDLEFKRRQWMVQRVAWILIFVTLVLGLLGLFGHGRLSDSRAGTSELSIEYQRFLRQNSPGQLLVNLQHPRVEDGVVRLAIGREFLNAFRVEHIMPQPLRVRADADELTFEFAAATNATAVAISFDGTADRMGSHRGVVRNPGAKSPPVQFDQFTYP
jgi:hypothetical protein